MATNDQYLSVEQVCQILDVHRNTVENWLRSGKLKGQKFGKLWRIKYSDLENMGNHDNN
ncbi:helix-turn-helix domain-containing protein [Patescibacteria group bacterium]|nr:helix-turn-helix domain-containing protein [Patescibacteria group bacterium]